KAQLLASHTDRYGMTFRGQNLPIQKCLVHIEPVKIGGPRTSVSAIFKTALKFRERPYTGTEVEVRRKQISLQEIAILVLGPRSKIWLIEQFEPLPNLSADRYIPILPAQRDVLQSIQPIGGMRVAGEKAPVFVISKRLIGRPCFGGIRLHLAMEGQY